MQRASRLLPVCASIAREINALQSHNFYNSVAAAASPLAVGSKACVTPSQICWGLAAPSRLCSSNAAGPDSQSANGLTKQLEEAGQRGDLSAVLGVVESAGKQFNDAAVEAALTQVERCVQGMSSEELQAKVHNTPTFQMLADMAVGIAGTAPPEVLARTIGVLGRLRFGDQLVLDELARGLMGGVGELQPQQLQQLVEGLRDADHSPGVLLLDAINERLAGLGSDMQQQHVESVKQGLQDLGHTRGNTISGDTQAPQDQPDRIKYT
eukprot:GHRQ01001869.1.p1 GENE.GHRQ01001869.1~~GHRQ01001869.1.p1  ORF type:complete len:293 (+),score=119.49 GHRQ01001869.1:81-881(+)